MKTRIVTSIFLLSLIGSALIAQTLSEDPALDSALRRTGLLHMPLPIDYSKSFEAAAEKKKILHSEPLCTLQEGLPGWKHSGIGTMVYSKDKTISGTGSIRVDYPAKSYSGEIKSFADFLVKDADWQRFNRVSFWVYPDCEGARILHMSLLLHNEGKVKIPYAYNREGAHYVNLVNREWNHVLLEIDENGRDKVSRFAFSFPAFGQERTMSDIMRYYVDKIELQRVEDPEKTVGWQPANNRIVYSTTGYTVDSEKTALVRMADPRHQNKFQLLHAQSRQVVFEGDIKHVATTTGEFDVIDFSAFTHEGLYQLKAGELLTPAFRISQRLWENSLWRVTNYFFGERCGFDVPQKHTTCHSDILA
jgi:hypothetical protein